MIAHTRLLDHATSSGWADTVLRQRARSVLHRSGLFHHLPLTGLMLELGSATGHLAEAVLRRMPSRQVVLADPASVPPRRLARRMATRPFHAVRATGESLPFADDRFDAAWAGFALQRMPAAAQARVLAELSRVVRRGGTLILFGDVPGPSLAWASALRGHGWTVTQEVPFARLFPPTALRPARHLALVARLA